MIMLWLGLVIRSFFGVWQNNIDRQDIEIPQSSDTWFVNNLINSWDIDSWNTENPNNTTTEEKKQLSGNDYTEINVMMPRYFNSTWREDFAKNLYNENKIIANYIYIDDLNVYRNNLSKETFSDADIFLFPYDWNDFISTQSFSFQKSLEPAFDDLVYDIVQDSNISFLPFAADPMIMYILSWYTINDFSQISNFVEDWTSRNPIAFPIFYWITDEDYYGKWFSREYKDIVRYSLLHFFTRYDKDLLLSTRIDSNMSEKYKVSNLNTILSKINVPECKYYPSICFQLYNFVWLRFGFLSDIDIVRTYFSDGESKFNEIKKQNFPFSEYEVPVRIRWRSIPNSLTDINKINAVYSFLVQYMNWHNKYNLRNSTLSTFKSEEWYSIIDNSFIGFRWYILSTWWNFVKKLLSTRDFWQLLDYEISAKDYLKKY